MALKWNIFFFYDGNFQEQFPVAKKWMAAAAALNGIDFELMFFFNDSAIKFMIKSGLGFCKVETL